MAESVGGRALDAEGGDGLELDAVRGGWAHGPGSAVLGERGCGEGQLGGFAGAEAESSFGVGGGLLLREENADVVCPEGGLAGPQD